MRLRSSWALAGAATFGNVCQPDKNVESFTVGTLLKITNEFPMTVIISRGKVEAFRWDTIQSDGKWSEDYMSIYQKQDKDVG